MTAPAAPGALRIGTRGSALALAQSGQVGGLIAAELPGGGEVELVRVSTHGDRDRVSPLAQIGGTGVFVTAVREALAAGEVDAIVHSAKDLPTAAAEGIVIGCIPPRADVRDALCARDQMTLAQLPPGARVGTGSPRRAAQLLRARPDLQVVGVRGNVDTRLARALGPEADLDAVVLASAGLQRLGREGVISELLDPRVMLPAPAQGALAVERRDDAAEGTTEDSGSLAAAMDVVDDPATRAAVTAERAVLRALEAGCSAPVAALAEVIEGALVLRGLAISPDGRQVFEGERRTPVDLTALRAELTAVSAQLGAELAADLLGQGAGEVLAGIRTAAADAEAARAGAAAEDAGETR